MSTREEFIAALRELADFLADHPDVRTPAFGCDISVIPMGSDVSKAAAIDAIAASLDVKAYVDGDAYECSRRFGPINYRAHAHTQATMQDWNDTLQLGAEALAARKATEGTR